MNKIKMWEHGSDMDTQIEKTALLFDAPSGEPQQTSAQTLYCQKPDPRATFYIYLDSAMCGWLWKANRMYDGRSRSSKVIDFSANWKRLCDFRLVTSGNLCHILHLST